jgi:GNAT superfamily N-acetyltransferase
VRYTGGHYADAMNVVVTAAEPEDAERIVDAYTWLFAPPGGTPPRWDPEQAAVRLRRAAGSDGAVVLVARDGGEVVGFCTVYDDIESVRFGRRAWVEDLAVHPERRSLGTGKRLLDAAKAWARERGATHLELDSADARLDAHRFYERERPSWRSTSFGWQL